MAADRARPAWYRVTDAVGRVTVASVSQIGYACALFCESLYWLFAGPRRRQPVSLSATVLEMMKIGVQAIPITAILSLSVGIMIAIQGIYTLRDFGAEARVVDAIAMTITREFGALITAFLVAGRSGSAITAQLGVMRVTQELDAMAVMGIPHTLRLILPKMLALAVSMPLIVLWTDAIALLGGMVSARAELGIGYAYFLSSLPDAVPVANLWLGLGKGIVFGLLIALVACHFGLRIEPNTESLGIGTTSSVVTSITVVIIVDAVFAIMFKDVGII